MPTDQTLPKRRDDHLTDVELNELVDGTLSGRDLERVNAHLTTCQECDERLQTLRAVVFAMQQAPSLLPRRSFQLTPDQAKLPEKTPSWIDRFAERILPGVPAIKLATIAVALLLVSVTAFDVLTDQSGQGDMSLQPQVMREADLPAPEQAQPAATEIPMVGESSDSVPAADSDSANEESATGGGADSAADTESADESFTSSAMQEVPPAPAAAIEQAEVASPTSEPTATSLSTATVTATATPTPDETGWSAELKLSWWRIAELGLLMILVWLIVSWVGRRNVESLDD